MDVEYRGFRVTFAMVILWAKSRDVLHSPYTFTKVFCFYINLTFCFNSPAQTFEKSKEQQKCLDEPARHLFIWSILLNQQNLAKLFWSEGKVRLLFIINTRFSM